MRNRRVLWVGVATLLLGLVLIPSVWLLFREPEIDSRRLPDGTTVSLVAVTMGKSHRCDGRTPWQKLLEALGQHPRVSRVFTWKTKTDTPVFWIRARLPTYRGTTFFGLYSTQLSDEHGCRLGEGEGKQRMLDDKPGPHEEWYSYSFPSIPRRSRRLVLHFWAQRSHVSEASIPIDNFLRANPPEWKPEPYPVRRRGREFDFSLTGMDHDRSAFFGFSRLHYSCPDRVQPGESWQPVHATVADSAGNLRSSAAWGNPATGIGGISGLCERESAWRLRLELARPWKTHAPPDYEWTFSRVAVPAFAKSVKVQRSAQSGDVALRLTIADTASITSSGAGKNILLLTTTLTLSAAREGLRVNLREAFGQDSLLLYGSAGLQIDSGIEFRLSGVAPRTRWWKNPYSVPCPRGAKQVDLRFVGWRNRTIDCMVEP